MRFDNYNVNLICKEKIFFPSFDFQIFFLSNVLNKKKCTKCFLILNIS